MSVPGEQPSEVESRATYNQGSFKVKESFG